MASNDRTGLLSDFSSMKGSGRPSRTSDASLMEAVRARLETTTQAFSVPGVSSDETSKSGTEVKHKLKPRKTCGREISLSFRGLLLTSITVVMIITMLALLITQIIISRDISNSLIESCNESANILLDEQAKFVFFSLVSLTEERMSNAALDLRTFLLNQAQAQVGSLANLLWSTDFDDGPVTPQTFNVTGRFIFGQVAASYAEWVDLLAVGQGTSNNYLDASECHNLLVSTFMRLEFPYLGTCPLTVGVANNLTTLVRCEANTTQPDTDKCSTYSDFVVKDLPPFRDQADFSNVELNNTQLLMWSKPYQLEGLPLTVDGKNQSMIGVSLSYPIFSGTCQSYGCVDTVVWSTITSRSFAGFCKSEVVASNFSQFGATQNQSAFYVVEGRSPASGVFLGGVLGEDGLGRPIIPDRIYHATAVNSSVISQSAEYLLSRYGSFANESFDKGVMETFNNMTLEPCEQNFNTSLPFNLTNCTLVAALSVLSPITSPMFHTLEPARMVIVYTVPLATLLSPLTEQFLIAQQRTNEQRVSQEQSITALVGAGAGIAIGAIIAGIIVAWLMAVRVSRPIKKLDKWMRNLINFRFQVQETDYLSRVSDISNVERTLESLSYAIEVFSKFVPQTVVRGIIQGKPESTRLHVQHRIVTVAFSDIKGFTTISEKLEISDLLFFLTRYLTVMTEVVELYEGTVTEILGDGLLVLWNAPDDCASHAAKACAAALAMQVAVEHVANEFKTILSAHGLEKLSIRVGIHTGRVLAGNIGSTTKLKYGCLGDTVNTASRLEGLCKLYGVGILCSKDTFDMLPEGKFQTRELDSVQVKGKDQAVALYEVVDLHEKIVLEADSVSNATNVGAPPSGGTSAPGLRKLSTAARSAFRFSPSKSNNGQPASNSGGNRKNSIRSFGPIDTPDLNKPLLIERIRHYETALKHFQRGEFSEAIDLLETLNDPASELLVNRARNAMKARDNGELNMETWNGVNRLTEKF